MSQGSFDGDVPEVISQVLLSPTLEHPSWKHTHNLRAQYRVPACILRWEWMLKLL